MPHDFWDMLNFTIMLSVRDYYRDKASQRNKAADFYQKCTEEIADESGALFDVINDISKKANPTYDIPEIVNGSVMLPVYGFYKVLQAQGKPTPEQMKVLDIFFRTLTKLGFSKAKFLGAVSNNNAARQKIEDLVGISQTSMGTFWQSFFKTMYITNSDEATLQKVTEKFSAIIMHFSILGNPRSSIALEICNNFISSVHKQIVECRKLPEEEIDYIGEVHFTEHYSRMKKIAHDLVFDSGDQDKIDIDTLFCCFSIGIIYQLIKRTSRSMADQAEMLDKSMKISNINFDIDGYQIMQEIINGGDLASTINGLVEIHPEFGGFWGIMLIASERANRQDDGINFTRECMGYLVGLESELAKDYSFSGFGSIAKEYMIDIIGKIAKLTA